MVDLDFDKMNGLVPTIIQDEKTNEVLMLGFVNKESWDKTLETGKAWFYSRTRNKLWMKGEQSGHIQIIKEIKVDCDNDSVILKVEQVGGITCHTGNKTCFYRNIEPKSK